MYRVERWDRRMQIWALVPGGLHDDRTEAAGHARRRSEGKVQGPYRVRDDEREEISWGETAEVPHDV
jgi:hypothetical protein